MHTSVLGREGTDTTVTMCVYLLSVVSTATAAPGFSRSRRRGGHQLRGIPPRVSPHLCSRACSLKRCFYFQMAADPQSLDPALNHPTRGQTTTEPWGSWVSGAEDGFHCQ
ncbi:uncharacterized protein PSFLO_00065 [Pseudozyma flocculosa]|uniref:Uncharacterized protein n=1 Tax=Pseudozyma flocculosa TaxID=84751 RepID=A0A5C3EQF4_9BASI|nr:uncharacterized protein PSFLO_00065 [Pseudozyma flocculosa]